MQCLSRVWLLIALAAVAGSFAARSTQKPNVIFILLDDLGSADVSFSHKLTRPEVAPSIDTPSIDALADSGIKLKQYYTHHICAPTRAAFLTGRYHTNLGNPFPSINGSGSLPKHYHTLADELATRGYRNYYVGKWGVDGYAGMNAPGSGWGPTERGFDEFYGLISSAHDHYSKLNVFKPLGVVDVNRWTKGGAHLTHPDVDAETDVHSTTLFTREAISYVRRHTQEHTDKPFFLQLSYSAPHDPLLADDEWIAHPSCRHVENWRRRVYCGMVVGVDQGIGNLTQALETMPEVDLDNTVIIFSSDNGGAPIVGGFNTPYRGAKAGSWEGSCRVAGFIRAPTLLGSGGRVWPGMVHVVDWAPTILSLVDGIPGKHALLDEPEGMGPIQGPIDGMDMSAALRDSSASPRKEALLVMDIFLNRTAYVLKAPLPSEEGSADGTAETTWKLVMGHTGEAERSSPPTGRWSYDNGELSDKFSEVYRNAIITVLGVEFYPFEWAFYFMFGGIRSVFRGTQDQMNIFGHWGPITEMRNLSTAVPLEEWMPVPEWNNTGNGLWLFDLDKDPYETTDLSLVHPRMVAEMTSRLHEIVALAPGQHGAIHFTFRQFVYLNGGVLYLLTFLLVVASCCSCKSLYNRCRRPRTPPNNKDKQE